MNHESIKNKLRELFNSTPENVGVTLGKKVVDGVTTDRISITFMVEKKLPISEIPEGEILPSEIIIDDIPFATDVIETGRFSPMVCNTPDISNNCYDWRTTPPSNRQRFRAIRGGTSLASEYNAGHVGTLGFVALDRTTQAYVAVSNNHVINYDPFFTGDRDLTAGNDITSELSNWGYQYGETSYLTPDLLIGFCVRYVPILLPPAVNTVDGAMFGLFSSTTYSKNIVRTGTTASFFSSDTRSWEQQGLTGITTSPQFATTAELNDLINNPPTEVFSAGRTTGPKQGICGLKVIGIHGSASVVPYYIQGTATTVNFEDLIVYTRLDPTCPDPVAGGDSGSALLARINGTVKIIGLVFAGGGNVGSACRIDNVANELDIVAWDGTPKNFLNFFNRKFITLPGGNYNKTITCSGETYWQIGATTVSKPCS